MQLQVNRRCDLRRRKSVICINISETEKVRGQVGQRVLKSIFALFLNLGDTKTHNKEVESFLLLFYFYFVLFLFFIFFPPPLNLFK